MLAVGAWRYVSGGELPAEAAPAGWPGAAPLTDIHATDRVFQWLHRNDRG